MEMRRKETRKWIQRNVTSFPLTHVSTAEHSIYMSFCSHHSLLLDGFLYPPCLWPSRSLLAPRSFLLLAEIWALGHLLRWRTIPKSKEQSNQGNGNLNVLGTNKSNNQAWQICNGEMSSKWKLQRLHVVTSTLTLNSNYKCLRKASKAFLHHCIWWWNCMRIFCRFNSYYGALKRWNYLD